MGKNKGGYNCGVEGFLPAEECIVPGHFPVPDLSPRFKKYGKIRLGSKLSLGLIYGLSFRFQAASYFSESLVQKTGLIFYLADFHGKNWSIPSFYKNKTQH